MKPEDKLRFAYLRLRKHAEKYPREGMSKDILAILAEDDRLQAIADEVPKTADEVPVVPKDSVWIPPNIRLYECDKSFTESLCQWSVSGVFGSTLSVTCDKLKAVVLANRCYSTRKAAEAKET